jgi:membrane dipeptidase
LENDGHLDLTRLKSRGSVLQFYAAWIDPKYEPCGSLLRCLDIIDKFYGEAEKNGINIVTRADDVDKGGALLSVEGGSALCGRLSALRALYKTGVRAMTLTWNGRNALADGVGEGEDAGGLSSFGRSVVREMNRMGMIVDVSHLSPRGFWEVARICDAPFIASHSNAKALCGHCRNLTNEQIAEIISRDGFIGINFCPDFLNENGASIADIIRHIEYMMSLGGETVLGFGADFDGIDALPRGIEGVQHMNLVAEELCKLNYSESQVEGILYRNLHRAVKLILKN